MKVFLLAAAAPLLLGSDKVELAPPKVQIFSLFPSGGRPGGSVDVEVLGTNLSGVTRLESGCAYLTGEILDSTLLSARVRLTLQPWPEPSLCSIRLVSRLGISNVLVFRVEDTPNTLEQEPNDTQEQSMRLSLPVVVNGKLYPDEDVDFFQVEGKAGQRLVADLLGGRNGSGLDAEMYLLNEKGKRLAIGVSEEGVDPVIRYPLTSDGIYRIVVRGSFHVLNISFPTGHPAYVYQLRVSVEEPRVSSLTPFHMPANQAAEVQINGESLQSVDQVQFSDSSIVATILERSPDRLVAKVLAPQQSVGSHRMWLTSGQVSSARVNFLVTARQEHKEKEPNGAIADSMALVPDEAVAGEIRAPGDVDLFSFVAPEDGLYVWELQASDFPSMLDPKIELLDSNEKILSTAEGAPSSDLRLSRKLKKDEKVFARVTQGVLNYFGPSYTYRLWVRYAQPSFVLTPGSKQPTPKLLGGADRVYLPRGMEFAIPIQVRWTEDLEDIDPPIRIDIEGLPPGVEAVPLIVQRINGVREKASSPLIASRDLIVRAHSDVQLGVWPIRIRGTSGDLVVYETIRANASGPYVMSVSGGTPQQIDHRYLNIIDPPQFELRPEIGDERYPTRFTIRPGSKKLFLVTLLSNEADLPEMNFAFENLPRGIAIEGVERLVQEKQYRLWLQASPEAEPGWRPMVILAGKLPKGEVVTTPYFGMSVQ